MKIISCCFTQRLTIKTSSLRPRHQLSFTAKRTFSALPARAVIWRNLYRRVLSFFTSFHPPAIMDVTRSTFHAELPRLLKVIADAEFIAFDLELSGIPQRQRRSAKQTIQERYIDTKEAAEKYHILQVGLTCVEHDKENECYLTRAYNFNLNPMIVTNVIELDRNFTYSAGAVDFLLRHGYQMDSPFRLGIPYVMHEEVHVIRDMLETKLLGMQKIPDIPLSNNHDAQAFTKSVTRSIDKWLKTSKPHSDYLNILPPTTSGREGLSSFERRLVYQLVRSQYPTLTASKHTSDTIQITKADKGGELSKLEGFRRRNDIVYFNQFGFSWIPLAMAGGKLAGLQVDSLPIHKTGTKAPNKYSVSMETFQDTITQLEGKKTALIGHNCMIDLVYFYRFFYGKLPDTVEEFSKAIQSLFHTVIDTKYMATADEGAASAIDSQLWQINEALAADNSITVKIESAADVQDYDDAEKYHEAGYDSYVTATTFIRLANKLSSPKKDESATVADHSTATSTDIPVHGDAAPNTITSLKTEALGDAEFAKSKFSHQNKFEQLGEAELEETPVSSSQAKRPADVQSSAAAPLPATVAVHNSIPGWDDVFWSRYRNKLRAYGTQEELYDLTSLSQATGQVDRRKTTDSASSEGPTTSVEEVKQAWYWTLIPWLVRSIG